MIYSWPYYKQPNEYTCGPACVKMILDYFQIKLTFKDIVKGCKTDKNGTLPKNLNAFLRQTGLKKTRVEHDYHTLRMALHDGPILAIIPDPEDENEGHYVIALATFHVDYNLDYVLIADPYYGIQVCDLKKFLKLIKQEGSPLWRIYQEAGKRSSRKKKIY